jgi:hypothetical protein
MSKIGYKRFFGSYTYAMVLGLPNAEFRRKIATLFENNKVYGTVYDKENVIPLKLPSKAFEEI